MNNEVATKDQRRDTPFVKSDASNNIISGKNNEAIVMIVSSQIGLKLRRLEYSNFKFPRRRKTTRHTDGNSASQNCKKREDDSQVRQR